MANVTRRGVLSVLALGVGLLAASAGAQAPPRWLPEPWQSSVALEDAFGNALPAFAFQSRTFVLGEAGERYVIRVTNPTGERMEAVVSVDGRDAVSGRVADYRAQRGYILPPYGSVTIDGFRQSLSAVAAFRFASPRDSYSARMGTPENVGIVGVALFAERKRKPRPAVTRRAPRTRRDDGEPAKGAAESRGRASAAPRDSLDNLGTEYGETRESRVVEAPFERASARPSRVLTVRYDDAEGLRARGIDVRPRGPSVSPIEPVAFPNSRFAQPPPDSSEF